jgi:CheY-like chemotaxis protein
VEDDLVNRKVALKMLEEKGYNVEAACNGIEALELFSRKEFDAVLMDIQMPEMDGIEASRRMREMEGANRHTPIIALTAYALQGDREKYIGMGMDGYVTKPFQMCDLFTALERAVSACENRNSIPERVILAENGEVRFAGKSVPLPDMQTNQVLAGIEEHIREAEAALPDNNLQGVEYAAHCIKEMSDEIHADGIRTAAFKEELAVRRGDLNAAAAWLENIRTEVKKYNKSTTAAEGGKGYENTRSGR